MNAAEDKPGTRLRPADYWRLWVLDTALVSAGCLFFLATCYGTGEFLGRACAMAMLPLIPVLVLVGGAGSTVFALTKVWIERCSLNKCQARALLVGPALLVPLGLGLLGAFKSPAHRLAYICLGNAPPTASQVQITGYSTFLREEWLAVFTVGPKDFGALVTQSKLVPADAFAFQKRLDASALKDSRLGQSLPALTHAQFFKRVFKPDKEHERGRVYAVYDAATATAIVLREYRD